MKFMLTASINEEFKFTGEQRSHMMQQIGKLIEELSSQKKLVAVAGLEGSEKSTRVTLTRGKVKTIDGPFAETKEVLGGAWIVEVESKADAVAISTRVWEILADTLGPDYESSGEVHEVRDWVTF